MTGKRKNRKINTGILTLISAAIILCFIVLVHLIARDRDYSAAEKRTLSQAPALSLQSLVSGSYMEDLEEYLSDQFPGRDFAVNAAAAYDRLTGPDISNDVLKGRKGWLFQLFKGSGHSEETEVSLIDFLSAYDISTTVLLVPDSVSVAEESSELKKLVPAGASVYSQRAWYRDFSEDFEKKIAESGLSDRVQMTDVFDELTEAWENGEDVYYKTDHHWTTEGAREAYLKLKDAMGLSGNAENDSLIPACRDFRGSLISKSGYQVRSSDEIDLLQPEEDITTIVSYEEEQETTAGVYSMEGLSGDDPYEVFFGGNHSLVRISSDVSTGRKLLVIKDSYANCLIPFLIPDFDSIVVIDPRYYNGDIRTLMDSEEFTDILVLYNINTFCEDQALSMILSDDNE